MEKEYDVYYNKYAATLSDGLLTDAAAEEETKDAVSEENKEELPQGIALDGFTTVFDIRVALTPVELVPLGTHTT